MKYVLNRHETYRHKKTQITLGFYHTLNKYYLFMTYIVTSKPKRISVAAGVVHIIILLSIWLNMTWCLVLVIQL